MYHKSLKKDDDRKLGDTKCLHIQNVKLSRNYEHQSKTKMR